MIRRELAVAPGEIFDMVRVKLSRQRLEGLQYFEKVDARPEPTTVPSRRNLVIGVDEKNTGNLMVGAGFSTVDAIVGYAEVSQGNFDLFHPAHLHRRRPEVPPARSRSAPSGRITWPRLSSPGSSDANSP